MIEIPPQERIHREPVKPFVPDGTGGFTDAEGYYYPRADDLGMWSTPHDVMAIPAIATGHIIETAMPFAFPEGNNVGYFVYHHRAVIGAGVYTIQQYANGMQQEWKQAMESNVPSAGVPWQYFAAGTVFGPCHCVNLSVAAQEASAINTYKVIQGNFIQQQALPIRSTAMVRKHTSRPGKKGQGRIQLAPIADGAQESGKLRENAITGFTGFVSDLASYNDVGSTGAASFAMVILNNPRPAPGGTVLFTLVTSVSCAASMSSVRDRVRVSR